MTLWNPWNHKKYAPRKTAYRARHRAAGLCLSCPLPTLPARCYCERHAEANRERARSAWLRRKATG